MREKETERERRETEAERQTERMREGKERVQQTSTFLTIYSRGEHDECAGAGGLDPGHRVHAGLHQGDL